MDDALHRITAEACIAPVDLPPFPASAMDGYAVRRAAWQEHPSAPLRIIGESLAGHPFRTGVDDGECVRIFTGAQMPKGADQVLLQEEVADATPTHVTFKVHKLTESYVRPIAHDVAEGDIIIDENQQLSEFCLGSLCAAGVASVKTYRRLRIGVFSTGDELAQPGQRLAPGQIYDSNRFTVLKLLRDLPAELIDLGVLADDPAAIEQALSSHAQTCDAIITSGGVSVGDADFVTSTIRTLGQLDFWKMNLKPGKPMAVGRIGDCVLFGLPGNPVSTIVTLLLVAKPALLVMAGCNSQDFLPNFVHATVATPLTHTPGRTEFQRASLITDRTGALTIHHTGDQSSNRLSSFAGANCLVEIPKHRGDIPSGSVLRVLPFRGLVS